MGYTVCVKSIEGEAPRRDLDDVLASMKSHMSRKGVDSSLVHSIEDAAEKFGLMVIFDGDFFSFEADRGNHTPLHWASNEYGMQDFENLEEMLQESVSPYVRGGLLLACFGSDGVMFQKKLEGPEPGRPLAVPMPPSPQKIFSQTIKDWRLECGDEEEKAKVKDPDAAFVATLRACDQSGFEIDFNGFAASYTYPCGILVEMDNGLPVVHLRGVGGEALGSVRFLPDGGVCVNAETGGEAVMLATDGIEKTKNAPGPAGSFPSM